MVSYVLVGGLLFGIIAGQISDALFNRAAAALPPDVRERIYQRESKLALISRILDFVALFLIILGIMKLSNRFPFLATPGYNLGYYIMAAGNLLGGVSMTIHGWSRRAAYLSEADTEGSHRKANVAFGSVLLFEVIWTAVILFMAFNWFPPLVQKQKSNTATGGPSVTVGSGDGDESTPTTEKPKPASKLWIGKEEALKILGVDAEHLDLLEKSKEVRVKKDGETLSYNKNDLTSLKQAEIPTKDELKERLKTEKPPEEPAPPKPNPERKPLQE